jgi:hypothetical protein
MRKMKKWLISARVMFGSAADTLESHLEEICNYFTNRTTSGVTEGINTRIKLIIRQSYGFKNFDLMKEKLIKSFYLDWTSLMYFACVNLLFGADRLLAIAKHKKLYINIISPNVYTERSSGMYHETLWIDRSGTGG